MMNWGRKKKQPSSSSSSSRYASISKLFPVSWLSKLMQNCSNSGTEQEKMKAKENQDLPMDSLLHPDSFLRGGSEAALMSFWNDSRAEPEPPFPSRRSTKPAWREQEETKKSSSENLGDGDAYDAGKVQSSREVNPKALSENKLWELQREAARLAKLEQPKDWRKLKHLKIREIGVRSETQKESQAQSLYVSRETVAASDHRRRITNQRSKVRAYSPRSEACKIKAIEDMKRARVRTKKKSRGGAELESFATVKRSSNPGQDFRDSMVEMIREKRICKPEELEELLACYLSLNCDEYHDLIIKVFREVWFELKLILLGDNSSPELQD